MKLFLLTRDNYRWDEYDAFVIRAKNEDEARELVSKVDRFEAIHWLDKTVSKCEEIKIKGDKKIILSSFYAGWKRGDVKI